MRALKRELVFASREAEAGQAGDFSAGAMVEAFIRADAGAECRATQSEGKQTIAGLFQIGRASCRERV